MSDSQESEISDRMLVIIVRSVEHTMGGISNVSIVTRRENFAHTMSERAWPAITLVDRHKSETNALGKHQVAR
jgi:hypothetical protein